MSRSTASDLDTKVSYRIDLASFGQDHVINIEATYQVMGMSELELFMPVWTPGSYLIREYARHLETISIRCESELAPPTIRKIRKNAWQVKWLDNRESVSIQYRLYAREKSVRTNWIEPSFAFLVGSATFITSERYLDELHRVNLQNLPEGYAVECSMEHIANERDKCVQLTADNFDELVDSPILVGKLVVSEFQVEGKSHRLVSVGNVGLWDHEKAASHVSKIVECVQAFWRDVPYESYTFQNLVLGGYGGLEHDNCCVLMSDPNAMLNRSAYVDWLGLVSHEYFHTWNVRRLRPQVLQNYDYESEQYTRELWIAEGITSYFDDLLVLRCGLCSEAEFLTRLSKTVHTVMSVPGRNIQSLEDSSFDTWIKHYRPDENSNNSRISYYTKGACVAWLLDVELGLPSDFAIRLDDVMRELWRRYRSTGYTLDSFESLVSELAPGPNWRRWFDHHVRSTADLDFSSVLSSLGLKLKVEEGVDQRNAMDFATSIPSETLAVQPVATLGCDVKDTGGRMVIDRIIRGGAASKANLQVDDEILAINDVRVTCSSFNKMIQFFRPSQVVKVTIFRRELIQEVQLVLDSQILEWKLEKDEAASDATRETRRKWFYSS